MQIYYKYSLFPNNSKKKELFIDKCKYMINPSDAISIIANRLKKLIDTNQLEATYEASDSTLSVYIDDIKLGRIPLLTLRLSDHNVNMHYFFHNRPTNPSQTTNLSVEFYKPKYKNGKRVRNRVGRNVAVDNRSHATPFEITYFSYPFDKLNMTDIEPIYQQILNYVKGGKYTDPFLGTDKEAKTDTVSANFIIKDPRNDIPQNINGDKIAMPATSSNYGADYVSKCKQTIQLNESDLRMMVQECVRRIITEESYKPIAHNKTIKLPNGVEVKSLVTLSDGAGRFDIYEDDGCYVVRNRNRDGDKDSHPWYIFPELLSALKKLPNLPLR